MEIRFKKIFLMATLCSFTAASVPCNAFGFSSIKNWVTHQYSSVKKFAGTVSGKVSFVLSSRPGALVASLAGVALLAGGSYFGCNYGLNSSTSVFAPSLPQNMIDLVSKSSAALVSTFLLGSKGNSAMQLFYAYLRGDKSSRLKNKQAELEATIKLEENVLIKYPKFNSEMQHLI